MIPANEIAAYGEGLGEAFGFWLDGIGNGHAEIRAIAKQPGIIVEIVRRGDDQDVADASQHQHRHRIIDHRLVIDRQQLLVHRQCRWMQARARAACQNNSFHCILPEALARRIMRAGPP